MVMGVKERSSAWSGCLASGRRLVGLCLAGRPGHQLDDDHAGRVSDPTPSFDEASIPSPTSREPSGEVFEELGHHGFRSHIGQRSTPGVKVSSFPQRDHPIGQDPDLLGFGFRGLNPLMLKQGGHQAPEQGPPMMGIPSELTAAFPMAHKSDLLLSRARRHTGGDVVRFHAEAQPHLGQDFLDLIEGFLPKVFGP